MRKIHFQTPQEVGEYLAQTLRIIDHADVPEDLRAVAFTAVFAALTGAQVFFDQNDQQGPVLPAMAIPKSKGH